MRIKCKFFVITIVVFVLISIADIWWFVVNPNPRFLPMESEIPQMDIIFTPSTNYAPVKEMGFINPEGKVIETRSYEIPQSLFFTSNPIKFYDRSLGRIFTWSVDGTSIGGIFPVWQTNGQGYPLIVGENGGISFCNSSTSIIAQDRILVISNTLIMAIEIIEETGDQKLVLFDMSSCRVSKVVYSPENDEYLMNFSYSPNALYAIEVISSSFSGVKIFDMKNNLLHEISSVKSPSFSKNGRELAYIDEEENICTINLENLYQSCFQTNAQGGISWSPDSKRIVFFTTEDKITLLELATGNQKQIADGYWPDWKP